jgi:hypothetical protein
MSIELTATVRNRTFHAVATGAILETGPEVPMPRQR